MIKPVVIDHIVLRTENYQSLINFYCEVIGCTVERIADELGLAQLRAGSSLIDIVDVAKELGQKGGPAPTDEANNLDHFCLQIEPFDEQELKDFLRSKGVTVGDFESRYGAQGQGRSLYISDTDGNTVELRTVQ